MKYAILIYGDETVGAQATPEQLEQVMNAWWGLEGDLQKQEGLRLAGEALQPTATATSVRVKDGKPTTTDGPFAETKEQLGGFYLLDCKDLDEAVAWAGKMPVGTGTLEVRPVQEFEQPQ
ncbi:MAG: YciI family protein [Actinomycetota bacterium]